MRALPARLIIAVPVAVMAGCIGLVWGLLALHFGGQIVATIPAIGACASALIAMVSPHRSPPARRSLLATCIQLTLIIAAVLAAGATLGRWGFNQSTALALVLGLMVWLLSAWAPLATFSGNTGAPMPGRRAGLRPLFVAGLCAVVVPALVAQIPVRDAIGLVIPYRAVPLGYLVGSVAAYVMSGLFAATAIRYLSTRSAVSRGLLPRAQLALLIVSLATAVAILLSVPVFGSAPLTRPATSGVVRGLESTGSAIIRLVSGTSVPIFRCHAADPRCTGRPRHPGKPHRVTRKTSRGRAGSDLGTWLVAGGASLLIVASIASALRRHWTAKNVPAGMWWNRLPHGRRLASGRPFVGPYGGGYRERVIRLYRGYLRQAKRAGLGRATDRTAAEHANFVARYVREEEPDARSVAEAYNLARFGRGDADSLDVAAFSGAVRRVKRALGRHAWS